MKPCSRKGVRKWSQTVGRTDFWIWGMYRWAFLTSWFREVHIEVLAGLCSVLTWFWPGVIGGSKKCPESDHILDTFRTHPVRFVQYFDLILAQDLKMGARNDVKNQLFWPLSWTPFLSLQGEMADFWPKMGPEMGPEMGPFLTKIGSKPAL